MTQNTIREIFPYLRVRDASAAIAFYEKAFAARETFRLSEPEGRIGHAQLNFGEHTIMLSDEYPEHGIRGPQEGGSTGCAVHLHVDDVDAFTQQAVDAGAELLMAPKDQFYGERSSKVRDPFGHEWLLGSHVEDVSHEEMQRRFTAMCESSGE